MGERICVSFQCVRAGYGGVDCPCHATRPEPALSPADRREAARVIGALLRIRDEADGATPPEPAAPAVFGELYTTPPGEHHVYTFDAPEPDEAERVALLSAENAAQHWLASEPADDETDVQSLTQLIRDRERAAERRGYERGVEDSAREAERNIIEYAEIDVLDTTPERLRIARRIRALASRGPR